MDLPPALPSLSEQPNTLATHSTTESEVDKKGIAFEDEKHVHVASGNAKELRRELTQDDKELAAANYDEIEQETKQVNIIEHKLTPEQLTTKLGTAGSISVEKPAESKGLSTAEAAQRLLTDGRNELTPPKKVSGFRRYLGFLFTLFNILLFLCGTLTYIVLAIDFANNQANIYIGAILIAVAFVNAGIEYYQVAKADAILNSFLSLVPPFCTVMRDGQLSSVAAAELVSGDVVLIRMGDKTPADAYIFAATDLKLDLSSLTGESEPQERHPVLAGEPTRPAAEAGNLAFNSTLCISGEAWGIVIRTGDDTFIGQIAGLTGAANNIKSPLSIEIDAFVKYVSTIAISTAILFFIIGIGSVYKGQAGPTVTFAITLLISWVPEGLSATVTLLLSIAAKRMAAKNVLVKDLQGVETLGSITLLATDKTGTLTRNQMTVSNVWTGATMFTDFQAAADDNSAEPLSKDSNNMETIIDICALNSRVKFNRSDVPFAEREVLGDATETGLTRFSAKYLSDYDERRERSPKLFEIPFNSDTKTALVIVASPKGERNRVLVKGAPERVLARCVTYLDNSGAIQDIDDEFRSAYDVAYDFMASKGHRVIGTAQLDLSLEGFPTGFAFDKDNCPVDKYCFVGLVSLEDPPKHLVRESIGILRNAGIQVMMVTGDHPKTAEAIARKINLITGETKQDVATRTGRQLIEIHEDEYDAVVVHGDSIDALQGWQWDQIFDKKEIVFARTSPKHKLEIVKHAQSLGHIVGVTGDGVNDAPALKRANLGIAMNISGSDVSKDAANMLLLDDNFSTIVEGVKEGRLIFANLKRSIRYTITHSIPEVIPQILYVLVPIPLPLSALLILVIDLGFELVVALTFAYDLPESSDALMRLPPRKPVTASSIKSLKTKALRRTKTQVIDPETSLPKKPTWLSRHVDSFKELFTKQFWSDKFESSEGEVLVDFDVLSYAYFEVGVIEMIGALTAYFVIFNASGFTPADVSRAQRSSIGGVTYFLPDSPDFINNAGRVISAQQQVDAWGQAQSITYISIFIIQCFNIYACKAKFLPPFGKQIVSNYYNLAGILGGACVTMFIIYTPPLHVAFGGSYTTSPLYWLIPMGFGCVVLAYTSARVFVTRGRILKGQVVANPKLQMQPTRYSITEVA